MAGKGRRELIFLACYCIPCFGFTFLCFVGTQCSLECRVLRFSEVSTGPTRAPLLPVLSLRHLARSSSSASTGGFCGEVGESASAHLSTWSHSAREVPKRAAWAPCSAVESQTAFPECTRAALCMSSFLSGWRPIWVTNTMTHVGSPPLFQFRLCAQEIKLAVA